MILFVHLIVTARQAPQLLKALREMALIQSVESSNRIEGVMVAPERLVPCSAILRESRKAAHQVAEGLLE